MKDEDAYYRINVHAERLHGGASGMDFASQDESSASSFFQEMVDASGVTSVKMTLCRSTSPFFSAEHEPTEEVEVKKWKWKAGAC